VALPRGAAGVERLALPLAVPVGPVPADAIIVAASPAGIVLLGARRARLQVCSSGAKVKLSLSFWPATMRP
jgi:hypothetical protein